MKVLIAGSSGMVGSEILRECLAFPSIKQVLSPVRHPLPLQNEKLGQVVINNFNDYDQKVHLFEGIFMAFFCIGAYTGNVKDDEFKKITVDYAVNFAKQLAEISPGAKLCLLSGAGADKTEKSRTSFAKYKGMAENQIEALDLDFYSFRPGYIYPVSKRTEPNMMYSVSRKLYPMIKLFGKNASIKSTELGKAMFKVGLCGHDKSILENKDILEVC